MNILKRYFGLRWIELYTVIVFLYLITMWISQSLINETVYYNTFSEQLTYDRAVELYGLLKKFSWIGLAVFPIILFVKITAISLVLYAGVIFLNLQKQVSLRMMFQVVTGSEIVFVAAGIIKALWFCFFAGNYTMADINFFYPVSLINLFTPGDIDNIWIFPLQTVNLFHLGYILLLAYGINIKCEIAKADSEKIVAGTYVPSLIIWTALIMFLSVNAKI